MKVTGQKFAQTMVMITHNEEIAQMADRIVRIEDGRIVARYRCKMEWTRKRFLRCWATSGPQ